MAHDRDDMYEGQEDGEYQFSDDQANYEMEPEEVKPGAAAKPAGASAASLGGTVKQFRKPIIGGVIFIILIFLIYKISAPSTATQPNTEFSQTSGAIPQQTPTIKQLPKPIKVTRVVPATPEPTTPAFQPLPQASAMSTASPTAAPTPITNPTPAPAPLATSAPTAAAAALPEPAGTLGEQAAVTAAPAPTTPAPLAVPSTTPAPAAAENYYNPAQPNAPVVVVPAAQPTAVVDKVAVLEQENAKLTAEYTQKLSEAEAQNTALQGKLQDLTMRIASLETTISHMGRTLQEKSEHRSMAALPPAQPRSMEPRLTYSVQAIIPGRAWLKSESGDTITIAEGDILKNYGRVMKIDPYDGVVQIDTGGRMLTLSYGVSSE